MTSPEEDFWIGSASRQAALDGPARDLHRAVLRRFLDSGAAPDLSWVRQAAAGLGLGDSGLAELEAADLLHLDGGVVAVAYPFSGQPTRQQVELDGFPAVYAMCAIDALGIPAMAALPGRRRARTPPSTPAATAHRRTSPPAATSTGTSWTSPPPSIAEGAISARCSAARV